MRRQCPIIQWKTLRIMMLPTFVAGYPVPECPSPQVLRGLTNGTRIMGKLRPVTSSNKDGPPWQYHIFDFFHLSLLNWSRVGRFSLQKLKHELAALVAIGAEQDFITEPDSDAGAAGLTQIADGTLSPWRPRNAH